MTIETINKSDAASRQLRAAIWLYFAEGEPLAVLTLAGAAHTLLTDLIKRRQIVREIPTRRSDVERMIREAKNFLKHANRDPESELSINSDWNDFLIYDALSMHLRVVDLLPLNSATSNLVKSIFEPENGHEEALYRRADYWISEAGRSRRRHQGAVPSARL